MRASLDDAIAGIRQSGATSVAVCFLHSYLNPVHELAAVERLAQALPGISISRSSDVLPQIKEYERVSTTIVNAYVEPIVRRYLTNLEARLGEAGFKGSLFVVLSHGGMAPVEEASRLAAGTVLSGPAGGMSGGRRCADLVGIPDLVPFDMGGTSTDISLISGGQASLSADGMLAGQRIALRSLDIASIAAGGGSIAQRRRQPHAAGRARKARARCRARPATAMADRPRPSPTPMSCSAISMRPPSWAASARSIARRREAAVDRVADAMELSRVEAAAGIYRMINLNMADGIRLMTLRRGVDPRKFALLSFGGAAGLHAAEVARELEIKRIIVPTVASVLSAWGMLTSDLRYEVSRTHYGAAARITADEVRELFAGLEQQAAGRLRSWFNGPISIERSAEMRYGEQIFEIDVSLDGLDWNAADLVDRIEDRFHRQARGTLHLRLARPGSRVRQRPRRRGRRSRAARTRARGSAAASGACAPRGKRQAFFGGWREVPVYALDDLQPGHTLTGPAIIEAETTTVLVDTGDRVTVNALGWLDIALR